MLLGAEDGLLARRHPDGEPRAEKGIDMRLEPLYLLRFGYPEEWEIPIAGDESTEGQSFFIAEGRCSGRINGRFRGANHPRRRSDATYEPNMQGVIETDDGATIFVDLWGYGRAYPLGRRQIVGAATHLSADERYRWLNDSIGVCVGEVRSREPAPTDLVIEMAELIWEPVMKDD
jgi:hypothetical protein